VKPRVRDLLQDALGCIVGLGLRPRGQNQLGALAGQRKRRLKKRVFGNSRCVSSVIREYSEEPLHTGQTLPAWTSLYWSVAECEGNNRLRFFGEFSVKCLHNTLAIPMVSPCLYRQGDVRFI
jgi:hypothetical protein